MARLNSRLDYQTNDLNLCHPFRCAYIIIKQLALGEKEVGTGFEFESVDSVRKATSQTSVIAEPS